MRDSGRFFLGAAVVAGLVPLAAGAWAETVDLTYDVYVGGSQVAEMRISVDRDGDRYRVTSAVGLVGMASMFSDWRAQSESEGQIADGKLIPLRYESYNFLRGEDRWTRLAFADGAVVEAVAQPSAEEDDREPVTAADWQNAIDPLTAVLAASLSPVDCGGPQRLFDGRRVTEVEAQTVGPTEAPPTDYGIYAGPATLCRYNVENVAGTSRRWEGERNRGEETMVWFAPLADDLAIPVRLESDTNFGALRGHLVAITPASSTN